MKALVRKKVRVRESGTPWAGKEGIVVAEVRGPRLGIPYRCTKKEYIVQFREPWDWCYFFRSQLKVIKRFSIKKRRDS